VSTPFLLDLSTPTGADSKGPPPTEPPQPNARNKLPPPQIRPQRPPTPRNPRDPHPGESGWRKAARPAALVLLLLLPLAWADLSEPTTTTDSTVILTDSSTPTTLDPTSPPPSSPGFLFTPWWSEDRGLVAVWDADLKANFPGWTGADSDCALVNPLRVWPMDSGYTLAGGYGTGTDDHSLNDPARTIDLLELNQIDLYLHDGRTAATAGYFGNPDYRCDWLFLAALNDAIAERGIVPFPPFEHVLNTGMILNNIEPDTNVYGPRGTIAPLPPDNSGEDVGMCYYRDWIARARGEAAEHAFHRLVIVDELTQSLASPLGIWQGQSNIWDHEDIAELRALATEPVAGAVDSTRRICDDRWAAEVPTYPDPALTDTIPAPTDPQAPVELWARVNVAQAPLYLLPSYLLGVPNGGSFTAGQTYIARWMVTPLSFPDPMSVGRITLRYFATTYDPTDDRLLTLGAKAKNTDTSNSLLTNAAGSDPSRRAVPENIYLVETVLYDPDVPTSPGGWSWAGGGPTPIDIRLQAGVNTRSNRDRVFSIWGVEIRYEQPESTGLGGGLGGGGGASPLPGLPLATQTLSVDDAVGILRSSTGVEGPCPSQAVCRTNADLRIDHLLDGVSFAQDITAPWPDPTTWAHAPLHEAWAAFVQNARTHLSTARADGGPVQCLVDERAWVSDTTFLPNLDRDAAIDRVRAGLDHGDGAVVTWLTLEMEDMIDQTGRWAVRDPYIETHPYTAYLPRLSRNMVGEALLWEVNPDLTTYPECAGEWTVAWESDSCPGKWTYGPVGEKYDNIDGNWYNGIGSLDDFAFYEFPELFDLGTEDCGDSVDQPGAGSYTIDLEEGLYSGLRFGWEIKDDSDSTAETIGRSDVGDSARTPQMFRFAILPPEGCPMPADPEVVQITRWNPELYELYDGLTCILQGEAPESCGGTL
jgi:hypothetical protein